MNRASSRCLSFVAPLALIVVTPALAHAQVALTLENSFIESFQTYTGTGLSPTPAAGQLDSNIWRVTGLSQAPNMTFGQTQTAGDFAQGVSPGGATTSGLYAFEPFGDDNMNMIFGIQPSTDDFTPGAVTLRLRNAGDRTFTGLQVVAFLYELNNAGRSTSIVAEVSTDDVIYLPLGEPVTTAAAADTEGWKSHLVAQTYTIEIPPDGLIFVRFSSNDVGGSGSRDEIGIDSVSVGGLGCGDGYASTVEECDDGDLEAGDGCSPSCTVEPNWECYVLESTTDCDGICGDGLLLGDEAAAGGCDDGNLVDYDGCSETCSVEEGFYCQEEPSDCETGCGDGIVAGSEECEDGNLVDGDGCASCVVEHGYSCDGDFCSATCGDGLVAAGVEAEECDGGPDGTTGCLANCTVEPGFSCVDEPSVCTAGCGDGIITSTEGCDDENAEDGDGCSAICTVEPGYTCTSVISKTGVVSVCETTCGDALIAGDETCDDGDADDGDGCSMACAEEDGWTCSDIPSVCVEDARCGNGVLDGAEACDDGDQRSGDGCSATCGEEPGFACEGEPSICTADGDADGVPDDSDNCIDAANPGQGDLDGDGQGDVCDPADEEDDEDDDSGDSGGCSSGGADLGWMFAAAIAILGLRQRRRRTHPAAS